MSTSISYWNICEHDRIGDKLSRISYLYICCIPCVIMTSSQQRCGHCITSIWINEMYFSHALTTASFKWHLIVLPGIWNWVESAATMPLIRFDGGQTFYWGGKSMHEGSILQDFHKLEGNILNYIYDGSLDICSLNRCSGWSASSFKIP